MSVTGHSTETQFLEYIGKSDADFALQLGSYWEQEAQKSKKEPQLNVLKRSQ